jgi:hypothetical protein
MAVVGDFFFFFFPPEAELNFDSIDPWLNFSFLTAWNYI